MDVHDFYQLRTAEGWLELNNLIAAKEAIEEISPAIRSDPEVLWLRWRVEERLRNYRTCVVIANEMIRSAPNDPRGYINYINALFLTGQTAHAYREGLEATAKFPQNIALSYTMARHTCRLGLIEEAKDWLHRAFQCGDSTVVRIWANNDPDLRVLQQSD